MAAEVRDARELAGQRPRNLLCWLFNHKWTLEFEAGEPPYRHCTRCNLCITVPASLYDAGKY